MDNSAWDIRSVSSSTLGFPFGSAGKESACNAEDLGLNPGLGRSPGEGIHYLLRYSWTCPDGSEGKESACNAEDLGSIPGLGGSLGEGNGNLLQYSSLENSMERILAGYSP